MILCENLLKYPDQVDFDAFCRDFLPKLFSFRNEKVPNIRLLLARFIAVHLVNNERFAAICGVKQKSWSDAEGEGSATSSAGNGSEIKSSQLQSELELTIHYLANDKESDVKCYFQSTHASYHDDSCGDNNNINNNNNNNNEGKQTISGDVSMEIGSSGPAELANTNESGSPELPKIDSSSLSLVAATTSDHQESTTTSASASATAMTT